MRAWLERLAPRERLALLLGVIALALVLAYAVLWKPVVARHARLAQVVAEQDALLAWMQKTAGQIDALRARGAGPKGALAEGQSLLGLVDATTRAAGLAGQVSRVQPEGADIVRVWMDRVPFDRLIGWLVRLEADAGVQADSANVEAGERPGEVNARLSLKRAGGATS